MVKAIQNSLSFLIVELPRTFTLFTVTIQPIWETMKAVLLCNAEIPNHDLFWQQIKNCDLFVCADGGANTAKKLGIEPDIIIGDFDSVDEATLLAFSRSEKIKVDEQETTDFEKALDFLQKKHIKSVEVWGAASGDRVDHTIGNLSSLTQFGRNLTIHFYTNHSLTYLLPFDFEKRFPVGKTISLIPMPKAEFVATKGLKWALNSETLELGIRIGTLNKVTDELVRIYYQSGNLLLMEIF